MIYRCVITYNLNNVDWVCYSKDPPNKSQFAKFNAPEAHKFRGGLKLQMTQIPNPFSPFSKGGQGDF
jgi:hypothetical protein